MNTMWLKAFKQNLRDYVWGVVEVIAFFFFPKKPKDPIYSGNQEKPGISLKCLLRGKN